MSRKKIMRPVWMELSGEKREKKAEDYIVLLCYSQEFRFSSKWHEKPLKEFRQGSKRSNFLY